MLVTFGAGLTVAQGHRVEVEGVEGLARALESAPQGIEGWWSPHTWHDDTRDSDAWEGASAIGVDLDMAGHAPLPVDVAVQLEQLAAESAISGSIFHRTPAGARLIFVLATPCTDPALFAVLARGAARGVEDDLREHDLGRAGLAVDPRPHVDLARLFFNPNTTAKGSKRTARVVVMRTVPYPTANLRELAPPPEDPATPATTARRLTPVTDPARRAAAYVKNIPPEPEGNRDNVGFRVAALLLNDFALPESEARPILEQWCAACSPPLTERDVARLLKSAGKNGTHQPGQKLQETRVTTPVGRAAAPPVMDPGPPKPTPAADTPAPEQSKGIPLVRACDAVERPVEWVVENFLARGELTDLSGDPGVGKGGITASWAAAVTKADPLATVVMLATEDPLGRVKARLRAEGADLERVWFLDIEKPNASPILPGDIAELEAVVTEKRATLLVLDPALEFMAGALDSHKQQDVSAFMRPLLSIAIRTRVAILTVRHNNKNAGASALHRAAGSIAFTGTARIALTAAKNAETGTRALATSKNNLSGDKHTVGYDIVSRGESSVVAWGEVLQTSADELVNQDPKRRGPAPEKLEAACDLLRSILSNGSFMPVEDILRCAKSEGVSRSRIYLAKPLVGVKIGSVKGRAAWALLNPPNPELADSPSRVSEGNSGFDPTEDT
jgi:hypothetical protein